MICVVNEGYEQESYWFRVDPLSRELTDMRIHSRRVSGLSASPDGKYLAVQQLSEALSDIEIVNLPTLIRASEYKKVGEVGGFPGDVSIRGWNNGKLEVTSGTLLSHPPVGNSRLILFSDETFALGVTTGNVMALSNELQDPDRYYCAKVLMPDVGTRGIAVEGLRRLGDKSAIPCLDDALARESDENLRLDIREARDQLRDPVQHFCSLVSSQNLSTRRSAVDGMSDFRVTSAVSCLREALARESDQGLRRVMQDTLDALTKR
jgi:hypothetical protein